MIIRLTFISLLILQIAFWSLNRDNRPRLDIVPQNISLNIAKAMAMGDEELFFRLKALDIQSAGDSFGRSTPLKNYNYNALQKWWLLLEELNQHSHYVPSIASYYYAASQTPQKHLPYVIDYLLLHAKNQASYKDSWWWLYQSINHMRKIGRDKQALETAKILAQMPQDADIPIWAYQLHPIIASNLGEDDIACGAIANILQNFENIPDKELSYMRHFIKNRIDNCEYQ